jgi:3-methylfumaryl-CoA hydratase
MAEIIPPEDIHDHRAQVADFSDSMAPEQLQRFEALMNRDPSEIGHGSELPAGAHWAYFQPALPNSGLGVNGNPRNEAIMPPVDQPRRMWAGGKLKLKKPLVAGVPAEKKSSLLNIEQKNGSMGLLTFVTLKHQVSQKGALAIDEEQEFVFRDENEKGAHPIRRETMDLDPDWKKMTKPDAVQLFRFSAITFNSHRIHYDQEYARDVEGYPNLLIHAPYLLLLMLDAFKSKHDGKVITSIDYRSVGPVYQGEQITISGKNTDNFTAGIRITGMEGKLAMKATVDWTYSWK